MIRKASFEDIGLIEAAYDEHFGYEAEHGAFTVFRKGIYPTGKDAQRAVNAGEMYVYEENDNIAGSMIVNKTQPAEYKKIAWKQALTSDEVMVIHLIMVRPGMKGKGIASSLVKHAVELAENSSCKALRLDTGSQNIPAINLYKKLGFQVAATASMKVGNVIEHSGYLFLEKTIL